MEKQSIADALRAELERAQNTKMEMREMSLLVAGYIRSLPVLGYTPSAEDVDFDGVRHRSVRRTA